MNSESMSNFFGDRIFSLVSRFMTILGFRVEKKRKSSLMDFMSLQTRAKGLKFIAAVNNPCCDYDEIVSLVAESIGDNVNLPGEVIVEILCKLPVKSLIRFKTVCKPWNLLINSDVFIYNKHLRRPNPQVGEYAARKLENVGNRFPLTNGYPSITGACNGIVCLCLWPYTKYLVLLNSATREFSFVPNEPRDWNFGGFCYLPITREYKIVCFAFSEGGLRYVDITTLTLGKLPSVRVVKNVRVPGEITSFRHATCGTTMYWLGLDDHREIVVCYDVVEGGFSEMNMPPSEFPLELASKSLRVFKDSVNMFVSPTETFFDIWMLVNDVSNGKSWIKYRTVGPLERVVYPIVLCWNRWILCRNNPSQLEHIRKNLFYYDLETDQVEEYCDIQPDQVMDCKETHHPPIWDFVNYVESLVPVNSLVPYVDTDFS